MIGGLTIFNQNMCLLCESVGKQNQKKKKNTDVKFSSPFPYSKSHFASRVLNDILKKIPQFSKTLVSNFSKLLISVQLGICFRKHNRLSTNKNLFSYSFLYL